MTQLIVKRGPTKAAAIKDRNTPADWDSFLHSLWLDIIRTNPRFYDDAQINHATGHCPCHCTRSVVTEVRKRK